MLVYIAITWLQHYPEKLNHIAAELCVGNIRKYSLRLLTFVKLVFTAGLLVPCVCDAFGISIRDVYSLIMIGLILVVTAYYEYRIFQEIKSLVTFAPALLLPVLDVFGFKNTTFGD